MLNKLLKLIGIIFFFTVLTNQSFSEIVKKIEIIGNDRISDDTIILFSEVTTNQEVNSVDLNNLTKNLYSTNYFKDIKVTFNNGLLTI